MSSDATAKHIHQKQWQGRGTELPSDGKAMIAWRRKVMIHDGKAVNRIDMCGDGKVRHSDTKRSDGKARRCKVPQRLGVATRRNAKALHCKHISATNGEGQ